MTNSLDTILGPETKVLIVDDNTHYSAILKKTLEASFAYTDITILDCPQEAHAYLRACKLQPQLMFVDFRYPSGMNGCEFLAQLKNEGLMEGKTTFLITSEPTVENMKLAVSAGALGVVAKPFDRAELKRQIEMAKRSLQSASVDSF